MRAVSLCAFLVFASLSLQSQTGKATIGNVWNIDDISKIGGYPVSVFGSPVVTQYPDGKAIVFDGVDDGLIVQGCPLDTSSEFTIEIIIKPYASFPNNVEQRFLHIQRTVHENRRMLLELRLNDKNEWYVDTHIRADSNRISMLAKSFPHPVDRWYHIAFVYSGGTAAHFVNGVKEMSGQIDYIPVDSAQVSLGMRMDKRSFFKGAIKSVRLTPRALAPSEFLSAPATTAAGVGNGFGELLFSDDFEAPDCNWLSECEQPGTPAGAMKNGKLNISAPTGAVKSGKLDNSARAGAVKSGKLDNSAPTGAVKSGKLDNSASTVAVKNGKLDISVSAGASIWYKNKLSGNIRITYDAFVVDSGGANDRVSDLNAFWMATDPKNPTMFTRSGKFSDYDNLNLYYAGIGGHDNTTTRFRKYQSTGEKPVLTEYTDKEHLLKGNTLYRIAITIQEGRTQYFLNDMLYFEYTDAHPYTEGYFGFRTTTSHQLMDNFKVWRLPKE